MCLINQPYGVVVSNMHFGTPICLLMTYNDGFANEMWSGHDVGRIKYIWKEMENDS